MAAWLACALAAGCSGEPPRSALQVVVQGYPSSASLGPTAVSPDGVLLAVGTGDGEVAILDNRTGMTLGRQFGLNSRGLAFDDDGLVLASLPTYRDGIDLWDLTKDQVRHQDVGGLHVSFVASHPEERNIFGVGDSAGNLLLWDALDEETWLPIEASCGGEVGWLAFSGDGETMAACCRPLGVTLEGCHVLAVLSALSNEDRAACEDLCASAIVLEGSTGRVLAEWKNEESDSLRRISAAALSPDGRSLVLGRRDGSVSSWNWTADHWLNGSQQLSNAIASIAVGWDGSAELVALSDLFGDVTLFDRATMTAARTIDLANAPWSWRVLPAPWFIAAQPEGFCGVSARTQFEARANSYQRELWLWNLTWDPPRTVAAGPAMRPWRVGVDEDGTALVASDVSAQRAHTRLWDVMSSRLAWNHEVEADDVRLLAFSGAQGDVIELTCSYPEERIWEGGCRDAHLLSRQTGMPVGSWKTDRPGLFSAVSSAHGEFIALGTGSGFELLQHASGEVIQQADGLPTMSLAVAPVGAFVAIGGKDGHVYVWDRLLERLRWDRAGHSGPVVDVAFSADGEGLVSVDLNGGVVYWDVASGDGEVILYAPEPARPMFPGELHVAASPVDFTVALVRGERLLEVWDLRAFRSTGEHSSRRGKRLHRFETAGEVRDVVFWPNGSAVVAATSAGIEIFRFSDGRRLTLTSVAASEATADVVVSQSSTGGRGGEVGLVFTDEGLWDGGDAAGFSNSVLFRLGTDLRTADMLTLDQLGDAYNHPGLLADFIAGRAVAAPHEMGGSLGRPPSIEFVTPPIGLVDSDGVALCVRTVRWLIDIISPTYAV